LKVRERERVRGLLHNLGGSDLGDRVGGVYVVFQPAPTEKGSYCSVGGVDAAWVACRTQVEKILS
jgi:hypothetical protein